MTSSLGLHHTKSVFKSLSSNLISTKAMFLRLRTLEFLGSTISLVASLCYIGTAILPEGLRYLCRTYMHLDDCHFISSWAAPKIAGELRLKTSLVVYTWSIRDTSRSEMLPGHRVF